MTLVILVALFAIQKRGTASVGIALRTGDVRCGSSCSRCWAASRSSRKPGVLRGAQSGVRDRVLRSQRRRIAFLALGAVVLAVTGAEALYADMGHFGERADPPRVARCS